MIAIHTEKDFDAAYAEMTSLFDGRVRTQAEDERLGVLADAIHAYEKVHRPIIMTKIQSEDDWKAASVRLDHLHRACDLTEAEAAEAEALMTMMSAWDATKWIEITDHL
jgi:antitoxin component HigA of HigAB toxin-antitoxin module